MKRTFAWLSLAAILAVGGCKHGQDSSSGMSSSNTSSAMDSKADATTASMDMHNTVCPVSGDKVEDSKLTQVYDGKTYHLCCNDCVKPFKSDPDKYAKAVTADPAKYGVKQ